MKPGLFISIILVIGVVIAASFGLQFVPGPQWNMPDSVAAGALFVCPTESQFFDPFARGLSPFQSSLVMIFFFTLMLVFALYAWGLYKNLLADKYDAKEYKYAWMLAKVLFWATIVMTILVHAPNHFRTVTLPGTDSNFVLCESNSPDARPVRADAVKAGSKIRP